LVEGVALALVDDGVIAAQAEGGQGRQLLVDSARHGAGRVDVFHPDQPLATGVARQQPAAEGGEQRAGVEGAGGRGGEAPAVGSHGHEL
ncbi:hypothetical protein, partial [Pseudomonas viridiflava]|uniref:hypothetical protein n=1 Tax=Pseudomonas viridiflava TaxID=33069 RepID=UPI003C755D31